MRDDNLAREMDRHRRLPISPLPSEDLYTGGQPAVAGHVVASAYGLLVHYTSVDNLTSIRASGYIRAGSWLTPTPYAACMAPYNLGLPSPRNVCLLVDVSSIPDLWGPGTTPPSSVYPSIWTGRGIEFFVPSPIPFSFVQSIIELSPCGDIH